MRVSVFVLLSSFFPLSTRERSGPVFTGDERTCSASPSTSGFKAAAPSYQRWIVLPAEWYQDLDPDVSCVSLIASHKCFFFSCFRGRCSLRIQFCPCSRQGGSAVGCRWGQLKCPEPYLLATNYCFVGRNQYFVTTVFLYLAIQGAVTQIVQLKSTIPVKTDSPSVPRIQDPPLEIVPDVLANAPVLQVKALIATEEVF